MHSEAGEDVVFHGHPSWRSILGFYVRGLVGAVLAGAATGVVSTLGSGRVEVGWVSAAVLAALTVVLVAGSLKRIQTTYTITNHRLTINRGLLSRELHETRLERIQNVNASQSLLERLLGVGTVDFATVAGAEFDLSFAGVADPQQIVRTVDRMLRDRRPAGVPSSAGAHTPS